MFPSKDVGNISGNINLKQSIQAISFATGGRPGPARWVAKNLIRERYPAALYGDGGLSKTFRAMHLGLTVAAPGFDYWMGYEAITAPVVFMDFELDADEQKRRAYDLAAGMGLQAPPENFLYLPCVEADVKTAFEAAYETCADVGAKLLIIDSLGMALQGDAESSSDVLAFYRTYINPLRALGASPFIVDHQAKTIKGEKYSDKSEFGSVYKRNSNRSVLQISGEWSGNTLKGKLVHKKANLGPKVDDIGFSMIFEHNKITLTRDDGVVFEDQSVEDQIIDALKAGPHTNNQLSEVLKMSPKNIANRTRELEKVGKIVAGTKQGRDKVYRLERAPQEDGQMFPINVPNPYPREHGNMGTSPAA
jgi:RecA-family ATPase